jgi:hypothetical protein
MEERTEIDEGLRALIDTHVDLLREVELYKRLYDGKLASLLDIDRQIVDAIAPEITLGHPGVVYKIEERRDHTKRTRSKEPEKDFRYLVIVLPPGADEHGLPIYASRSVRELTEKESLCRVLQELAEKMDAKTEDGDSRD